MTIHKNQARAAERRFANAADSSNDPDAKQPAERAPYAPPRLEALGAWLLTLQQTSPEII